MTGLLSHRAMAASRLVATAGVPAVDGTSLGSHRPTAASRLVAAAGVPAVDGTSRATPSLVAVVGWPAVAP